jgi:hypothetical protein
VRSGDHRSVKVSSISGCPAVLNSLRQMKTLLELSLTAVWPKDQGISAFPILSQATGDLLGNLLSRARICFILSSVSVLHRRLIRFPRDSEIFPRSKWTRRLHFAFCHVIEFILENSAILDLAWSLKPSGEAKLVFASFVSSDLTCYFTLEKYVRTCRGRYPWATTRN